MCLPELFPVIYQDSKLLVVSKPADLVCHPTKAGPYSSLISRMRIHLGEGAHPQLVNRLDRETSGVTVAALNPQSARELRRIWESRQVEKEYWAIVHGHVHPDRGEINAPLGKDEYSRVAIKDCVRPDGATASTEYVVEKRFSFSAAQQPATLLRVFPRTGRKHQIRIHLTHLGHPLIGDKLYGGDEDAYLALVERRLTDEQRRILVLPWHALHAAAVRFTWEGKPVCYEAYPEPWFCQFAGLPST
jgi:23S rRNA pseudouridine1911/1915/1917 synthase